jgi:hypothetical protein
MSSAHPLSEIPAKNQQPPGASREPETVQAAPASQPATVLVRGETIDEKGAKAPPPQNAQNKDKVQAPRKISESKARMQTRLPALDDDADVGAQKEQRVIRDGKADLSFTGTLLASAAPASAPKGEWQEYRIYETSGGKHVFSKVTRRIYVDEQDAHQAEVFDPSPSSVPSQILRGARDLTRSHPMTWTDAAVGFFGYDPLAKTLYRKVGGQFEEHIS